MSPFWAIQSESMIKTEMREVQWNRKAENTSPASGAWLEKLVCIPDKTVECR